MVPAPRGALHMAEGRREGGARRCAQVRRPNVEHAGGQSALVERVGVVSAPQLALRLKKRRLDERVTHARAGRRRDPVRIKCAASDSTQVPCDCASLVPNRVRVCAALGECYASRRRIMPLPPSGLAKLLVAICRRRGIGALLFALLGLLVASASFG